MRLRLSGVCVMVFVGLLCFQACTSIQCGATKDQFITQYERFIDEVEAQDLVVTDPKWKIYDQNFKNYILECYVQFKEDLSFSERQTIIYKALTFYFLRYKSDMIRTLEDEDNETSVLIMQEVSEIWGEPDAIFKELTGEEWDRLVDEFVRDLEKWQQKIRKMFGEEETKGD